MKIAYYCPSINPIKGGVERVTYVLKKYFESKGHNVYCIAFKQPENEKENDLIFLPNSKTENSEVNKVFLAEFVYKNHIDIIIAQIGAPGNGSDLVGSLSNNIKKIACIHLDLIDSVRHYGAYKSIALNRKKVGFIVPFLENNALTNILVWLKKLKYKHRYEKLYDSFCRIVLLSDLFKNDFEYLSERKCLDKVIGIPNPLPDNDFSSNPMNFKKRNTLLYVGRINTGQKKVDYLLRIWRILSPMYPNWNLKIVGDGPDLIAMKKLAYDLNLERYSFEGYKNPESYYAESPILCLTSSYEGFGMVLIEAMKYGTVPIAFNSYASVSDIIKNGVNGLLVPPFNLDMYAKKISFLIEDANIRNKMSEAAIKSAKSYSVNVVGQRWLDLFESLLKEN